MAEYIEDESKTFSAIKFFRYFSESIKDINVAPMDQDTLVINKDIYEELGSDEVDEELPFAHLAFDFPTSNNDLIFVVDLYQSGVAMSVGSFEYVFCEYELLGKNEEAAAERVIAIAKALSNGQLSLLCTYTEDDEKLQAIEVLYRKPDAQKYDTIATFPMFESKRKLRNRELKTEHFGNKSVIDEVAVHLDTFISFLPQPPGVQTYNRKQIKGLHLPLSRDAWEKKINQYYEKRSERILSRFDKGSGNSKLSFLELVVKYGKWRHLELSAWSIALLLFEYVISWRLTEAPVSLFLFASAVIMLAVLRDKVSYRRYLASTVLFSYAIATFAAVSFLNVGTKEMLWWILGVCWMFSVAEVLGLDLRAVARSIRRTDSKKAQKDSK